MMHLALFIFLIVPCWSDLHVSVDHTTGSYTVKVGDQPWFRSAGAALYVGDRWYTSDDGSLPLIDARNIHGDDPVLGTWTAVQLIYNLTVAGIPTNVTGEVRQWDAFSAFTCHLNIGTEALTTTVGLNMTEVRTGFPRFIIEQLDQDDHRGFFTFEGVMMGYDNIHAGVWNSSSEVIDSGMEAGPVVLFNLTDRGQKDVLVLSPFSHFMATSLSQQGNVLQYGVMGSMSTIPANYTHSMVVFYSSDGVNEAIRQWGQFMQRAYSRDNQYRRDDITINYLGYYTDGGAYYYYNAEAGLNYQETMLAIHRKLMLPYHYMQLDSWWYYKGLKGGASDWESRPDVFPDGLPFLFWQLENIPLAAHNRYWAIDNVYSDQYSFVLDEVSQMSLPVGNDTFWSDLLGVGAYDWGLVMYEQDWLHKQTSEFRPLRTDIDLGRQWLLSMGEGADIAGVNIQYCSSFPRHALQALMIPRVTQARVSSDYTSHIVYQETQWDIGVTSMLADALGIAPFKDVFWSSTYEPGSSYQPTPMEPLPDREILLATLSTGPVGAGDAINYTNVERIMRCCRQDGLILKPDRPITMIDAFIAEWAENDGHRQGELYFTQTTMNNQSFHILFASAMQKDYTVYPAMIGLQSGIIWPYDNPSNFSPFDTRHPLSVSASQCHKSAFCLWYISPLWEFNDSSHVKYAFMGESNKWTFVSQQRFATIETNAARTQTTIAMNGSPSELVSLTVYHSTFAIRSLDCSLSATTGQGQLVITASNITCSEIA